MEERSRALRGLFAASAGLVARMPHGCIPLRDGCGRWMVPQRGREYHRCCRSIVVHVRASSATNIAGDAHAFASVAQILMAMQRYEHHAELHPHECSRSQKVRTERIELAIELIIINVSQTIFRMASAGREDEPHPSSEPFAANA